MEKRKTKYGRNSFIGEILDLIKHRKCDICGNIYDTFPFFNMMGGTERILIQL